MQSQGVPVDKSLCLMYFHCFSSARICCSPGFAPCRIRHYEDFFLIVISVCATQNCLHVDSKDSTELKY